MRLVVRYAWLVVVAVLVSLALATSAFAGGTAAKDVSGNGSTSDFLCTSGEGPQTGPANIGFDAHKFKGVVQGGFGINGEFVSKFGFFNAGTINGNSYSLTGLLEEAGCFGQPENTSNVTVTVSGKCGNGVVIHYRDSNGEVGDFLGNVECTTGFIDGGDS